jgi:magnesium-transporting ATPase (P-type)
LTGENVPINKSKLVQLEKLNDACHWVFEGAKVETMKENTFALAINIGFGSRRGRIIRKILTKTSKTP